MSWENNPNGPQNPGGQNPGGPQQGGQWGQPGPQNPGQQGGQWGAPQQGQQQGGQWGAPQQGQQQGGQWGAPQQGQQQGGQWGQPGGQPGQGFGGQPGQGFGGQGYDPNQQGYQPSQGFGGAGGGYGAPPSGYAGTQQRSSNKVILFVVVGVVVAALIGAAFMFFGKSKGPEGIDVPPPTTPATEPATPEPTATSTPSSRPTSSRPTSRPTTSQTTEPSGSGEPVGMGISVDPASGWTVKTRESGTVVLSHSSGALFIVEVAKASGSAVDQARVWQDNVAKGGTNVKKGDITQKPQVHPSLDVAEAEVTMNMSGGGGTQRVVVVGMIGMNESKQTASASQLVVPQSAASQASSLVSDANKMINSVLKSQV